MVLLRRYEPKHQLLHRNAKKTQKVINLVPLTTERKQKRVSISDSFMHKAKFRRTSMYNDVYDTKNEAKTQETELYALHEIFFKNADDAGYSTVGNIYQGLVESNKFNKKAEFLFHEFDFDMNKKIEFSQLVDYIEKCDGKNGYFYKKGKDVIFPNNRPGRNSIKQSANISTLRIMFNKYDTNHDGYLTFDELKNGLIEHFTKQTILEIFQTFDYDGNKLIDFSEFLSIFSPTKGLFQRKYSNNGTHKKTLM